ncbi:MAG TPA: HU family DNA-binding protein [Candidatus Sulfotelmatobacter sp.]|nr:HU family DNA-binding protein [Candidatus Sulfotelmatobacter sp.]
MNKQELCELIAKQTGTSKIKSMMMLDTIFNAICGSLKKGKAVKLVGFGTWKKVKRKARPGRNPQTGKKLTIPARNVIKFSSSQNLFDLVN